MLRIKFLIKKIVYRLRGGYTTESLIEMGLKVGGDFNPQLGVELDPSHCWLIEIGDNVTIAPHAQILAHDASMHHATGYTYIAPVTIGNNVFIGAGSIVLPGVTIGDNVVIGAGSVVSRDIPSDSVAVGAPARRIKSYQEFIEAHRQAMEILPKYGEEYTLRSAELNREKKEKMCRELSEKHGGYVV